MKGQDGTSLKEGCLGRKIEEKGVIHALKEPIGPSVFRYERTWVSLRRKNATSLFSSVKEGFVWKGSMCTSFPLSFFLLSVDCKQSGGGILLFKGVK